jgi:hypothetical protein
MVIPFIDVLSVSAVMSKPILEDHKKKTTFIQALGDLSSL